MNDVTMRKRTMRTLAVKMTPFELLGVRHIAERRAQHDLTRADNSLLLSRLARLIPPELRNLEQQKPLPVEITLSLWDWGYIAQFLWDVAKKGGAEAAALSRLREQILVGVVGLPCAAERARLRKPKPV